jgi:subtilisin family serine protease
MSIIVSTVSQSLNTAINTSINSGVTYVVAAGNYNMDACSFSPGSVSNAVTVGAPGIMMHELRTRTLDRV